MWLEIKTDRSLTNYHQGQNRTDWGKINLIYCQFKIEQDGEKQSQNENQSPFPYFPGSTLLLCSDSSTSSPMSSAVGMRNGDCTIALKHSCYQNCFHHKSKPQDCMSYCEENNLSAQQRAPLYRTFLFLRFPSSAWDPSHRVQSCTNGPSIAPSRGLQLLKNCSLQCGLFSRGTVLQEEIVTVWVPHPTPFLSHLGHRSC